jgi:ferritin
MLASERLIDAMNQQVGHEMGASMQYISIASYFDGESLPELARFFYAQAEEEREHGMKIGKFIVDAGAALEIPAIPAGQSRFDGASEAVELALRHEEKVTRQIYALVDIAKEDSNYIALRFLDWFVEEQFEEIATMSALLSVVERAGQGNLLQVEEYLSREGGIGPDGPDEE